MRLELTADLGKLSQIRDFVGKAVGALGIDGGNELTMTKLSVVSTPDS